MAGKPSLRYAGVTPTKGKTIRIARALPVTAWSEELDFVVFIAFFHLHFSL